MKRKTNIELFLELANPDENGYSRWVNINEFVGEYSRLVFGNGASWARKDGKGGSIYVVEFDKSITSGNGIDAIRLNGLNKNFIGTNAIRSDIKIEIKKRRCVILGTSDKPHKPIEVDHKNGRKNDPRVMNLETQTIDDFQPLSKAANDAKRQHCKICKNTNKRYDAKLLGYKISFTEGDEFHDGSLNGCVGCFWYDPIEFRKNLKKHGNNS